MTGSFPDMTRLFDQLGLPSTPPQIQTFIESHRPLAASTELHLAEFWNSSQSDFLCVEMNGDSDWVMIIDRLNVALRGTPLTDTSA